jgi:hypothetical protein
LQAESARTAQIIFAQAKVAFAELEDALKISKNICS